MGWHGKNASRLVESLCSGLAATTLRAVIQFV